MLSSLCLYFESKSGSLCFLVLHDIGAGSDMALCVIYMIGILSFFFFSLSLRFASSSRRALLYFDTLNTFRALWPLYRLSLFDFGWVKFQCGASAGVGIFSIKVVDLIETG
jgi:hypothetical protein